jgi:hypothetical protein
MPSENTAAISCIHVCSKGQIYVEREGEWYLLGDESQVHLFAEVGNFSEETWKRKRKDPPCSWPGDDHEFGRRHP